MSARILVVDDVPTNLKLLEVRLSAEYFEVILASNGAQAIEICERGQCDIVLLDVMMPGMDGFEVARRIKSNPATHHIPVVMVTALDQPADRVKGLDAGADDFLTKPVDDIALVARVRSLVRLKMATDEMRMRVATSRQIGVSDPATEAINDEGMNGRILIVEDHGVTAERVTAALSQKHTIAVASDPQEALFRAAEGKFDLRSSVSISRITTGCGSSAKSARLSARATCRSCSSPTPTRRRGSCAASISVPTIICCAPPTRTRWSRACARKCAAAASPSGSATTCSNRWNSPSPTRSPASTIAATWKATPIRSSSGRRRAASR